MCGIAGIVKGDGRLPDRNALNYAGEIMQSRGPDSLGIWIDKEIGFVHRRLSIVDLSEDGNQPMHSNDHQAVIVFNGEIYNYAALKEELRVIGYEFKSHSDTETILAGYQIWGIDHLLTRLDGMFAFALYDKGNKQMFLARDRFGKKPLYYATSSGSLFFASDIRAVVKCLPAVTINLNAVCHYFQEMASPQPYTVWNEIVQIEQGCYLKFDLGSNACSTKRYHQFSLEKNNHGEEEVLERVEFLLNKAIQKRLVSDVPISCFLSGGADSGLIVSLLALHQHNVNTFSVGFEGDLSNELSEAKKVALKYGTNHEEIILRSDIRDEIPEILENLSEPFADSSVIPSYLITKAMAGKYKVAISGDGGDELFGYPGYSYIYRGEKFIQKYPGTISRTVRIAGSKISSRLLGGENLGHWADFEKQLSTGNHLKRRMVFNESEIQLLSPRFDIQPTRYYFMDIWNSMKSNSGTDKLFAGNFRTRLINDYLVKIDRASMMNSIEVRSPFLDTELAQYSLSVKNEIKFKENHTKYILKKLAKKYVNPDIFIQKKKGFEIPLKKWISFELKDFMMEMLSNENLSKHDLIDKRYVHKLLTEQGSGSLDHTSKLWSLVCFQKWFLTYGG